MVMDAAPDMGEVDLGALRAHRRLRKLHLAVLFAIIEVCVWEGVSPSGLLLPVLCFCPLPSVPHASWGGGWVVASSRSSAMP